jgi:hypothetical protein
MARIEIHGNANWTRWAGLVEEWINGTTTWPKDVGTLKSQMHSHHMRGFKVEGKQNRPVKIYQYPDGPIKALMIPIPSANMLKAKLDIIKAGSYPRELMPQFYDNAPYGRAKRVGLSTKKALAFAMRRVGEYTVNECC